jgi:hypothetical protein
VSTLIPTVSITANAAGIGAIQLGTSGITGGGANWVYYGTFDLPDDDVDGPVPIKWRVLSATGGNGGTYKNGSNTDVDSSNAMFLLSEYSLNNMVVFGDNNIWATSNLKTWMTDNIYNGNGVLTALEKAQVLKTTTTEDNTIEDASSNPYLNACQLNGDTLFALSIDEATRSQFGFGAWDVTDNGRVAYYSGTPCKWWLRSYYPFTSEHMGIVYLDGSVSNECHVSLSTCARPAFNLNRNSVLFSSVASGGKSVTGMDSGLTAVPPTTPTQWKLTLLDSSRSFMAKTTAVNTSKKAVSITYSGATVGINDFISAVILDSGHNVKYYGRIAKPTDTTGTATIDITNLSVGDTLKVFSEQYNGDKKTDYASVLKMVSTMGNNVTFSLANLTTSGDTYVENALDYTTILSTDTGYLLPASISVTVGGTPAVLAGSAAEADTVGEYFYDPPNGNIKVAKVNGPVIITAAGVAKTYAITAAPTSLDFGSVTDGYPTAPAAQTVTITNTGNSTVTGYTVTGDGKDFNVTYSSAAIPAGGTSTFSVQPVAALSPGVHTATLSIQTNEGSTTAINSSFTVKEKPSSGRGGSSNVYYTVTATAGKGGAISPQGKTTISSGGQQSYTITADRGYEIKEVLIDGKGIGALSSYTFSGITGNHTIEAIFKEATKEWENPYADVEKDAWYFGAVQYVSEKGLMQGNGNRFNPEGTMTRAMFVTILYRLSGASASYTNPFSDVPSGVWYETSVAWAAKHGIVSGGNQFAPEGELTREQLAVLLYHYAKYKGLDVSIGANTNILSYQDASTISSYAYEALQWACGAGIMNGDGNGNLNPQGSATRAEVAKMISIFVKGVLG